MMIQTTMGEQLVEEAAAEGAGCRKRPSWTSWRSSGCWSHRTRWPIVPSLCSKTLPHSFTGEEVEELGIIGEELGWWGLLGWCRLLGCGDCWGGVEVVGID